MVRKKWYVLLELLNSKSFLVAKFLDKFNCPQVLFIQNLKLSQINMSKKQINNLLVIVTALIWHFLFWKENWGLNVGIFTLVAFGFLYYLFPERFAWKTVRLTLAGTVLAIIFVIVHNSMLSKIMYTFSLLTFVGFFHIKELRFPLFALMQGFSSFFETPSKLIATFKKEGDKKNEISGRKIWNYVKLSFFPLLILGIFYALYYSANSAFANLSDRFWTEIGKFFQLDLPLERIGALIFALGVAGMILWERQGANYFRNSQKRKVKDVRRERPETNILSLKFNPISLRNEYKTGVILLISLNALLFVVNLTDLATVWFGFDENNPGNLKSYVHEGTYILIFTILLAMGILLYLFRKNINFFPGNALLKKLAYAWIAQNVLLTLSVGVRNARYIDFHGLAYKRIGVVIFLLLTIYGLWTMYQKVRDRKSIYFLLEKNAWAIFFVLLLASAVNWDVLITRHNLFTETKGAIDKTFLLRTVSDKNLSLLEENLDLLKSKRSYPELDDTTVDKWLNSKRKRFDRKKNRLTWKSWYLE